MLSLLLNKRVTKSAMEGVLCHEYVVQRDELDTSSNLVQDRPRKGVEETIPQCGMSPVPLTPRNAHSSRICMVAYTFYETDSRVMRYAEALAQKGDDVEVFALRRPGTPRTEVLCGVRVHRLQGRQFNEKGRLSYLWRIDRPFLDAGPVSSFCAGPAAKI